MTSEFELTPASDETNETFQVQQESSYVSLKRFVLPEWIPSDAQADLGVGDSVEGQLEDENDTMELRHKILSSMTTGKMKASPLENLGVDMSTKILRHLSVQELASVSLVSKAMYVASRHVDLWKVQFQHRWNYHPSPPKSHQRRPHRTQNSTNPYFDNDEPLDWFQAYQQAYLNTHDLWITHWNCVDPTDGLEPGRCCIQPRHELKVPCRRKGSSNRLCPTCRFHPALPNLSEDEDEEPIATPAQAVAAATRIRIHQAQHQYSSSVCTSEYSPSQARRTFAISSTLHRRISTKQYQANALHFLSDLLFFQVHDSDDEVQDMKQLLKIMDYHDGSETAMHSWHLCHFTNPDYQRSLAWRISIMRKDCFTVYPSEGYLAPGESQVVVFGVKPLGSLLAHATQQLNAHREGVDTFWANVYTEEAHLPPAPFLIHYHFDTKHISDANGDSSDPSQEQRDQPQRTFDQAAFARAHPLHPDNHMRLHRTSSNTEINHLREVKTPWQRSGKPPQPVRIMYLSAHVNVHHTLHDFRRTTLVPLAVHDQRTQAYCAPQLKEFHSHAYQILQNLQLEREDSYQGLAYRTEPPCIACGNAWGARSEELGQAFVMAKLECGLLDQRRNSHMQHIYRVLTQLVQHVYCEGIWTERHHDVCHQLHTFLVDMRASPSLTRQQREVILQWEAITDCMCRKHQSTKNFETECNLYFMIPWRHAGVYPHILCTDSVYNRKEAKLVGNEDTTLWKEEPHYLEAFAHLAHSPGRFCLGPQEDPNHLRAWAEKRYGHRQRGCVSDMFFDDPVYGLQAALCVVSDPRSLMVHGVWDRVPYPGTLVRRPKLPILPRLCISEPQPGPILLDKLITSSNKKLYYELQTTLDMDALYIVHAWCVRGQAKLDIPATYPISLRNYIENIPPPGSGRFALSTVCRDDSGKWKVCALEIREENQLPYYSAKHSMAADDELRDTGSQLARNQGQNLHNFHLNGLHGRPGPRILNLVWVLSAHLGWTVEDNQGAASVFVDRRILIGAQWLSISLMAAPLFYTLFARYAKWIPATPIEYTLEALPFRAENQMRFLTEKECGYVSGVLFVSWLSLGRWIERYTSRDFFRGMLEHLPTHDDSNDWMIHRFLSRFKLWCQRQWDSVCPLFLQRMVFVPKWNQRSQEDLMKHVAFWRGSQHHNTEEGSAFQAISGGGFVYVDNQDGQIHLGDVSWSTKVFLGILVSLASFSASSPHFYLNLLTVFSSSISLGLSMSLQSMETGRAGVTVSTTGSIVETLSLVTIVILGFLVGQLVGSSGGVLFLAEFVVTSISLVLGGAGTISASAMESWGTFFCLAVTAFWGYLFGRVSIMEGIRQKRSGFSSIMLCLSLIVLAILWLITIFAWKWQDPMDIMFPRRSKL